MSWETIAAFVLWIILIFIPFPIVDYLLDHRRGKND